MQWGLTPSEVEFGGNGSAAGSDKDVRHVERFPKAAGVTNNFEDEVDKGGTNKERFFSWEPAL